MEEYEIVIFIAFINENSMQYTVGTDKLIQTWSEQWIYWGT